MRVYFQPFLSNSSYQSDLSVMQRVLYPMHLFICSFVFYLFFSSFFISVIPPSPFPPISLSFAPNLPSSCQFAFLLRHSRVSISQTLPVKNCLISSRGSILSSSCFCFVYLSYASRLYLGNNIRSYFPRILICALRYFNFTNFRSFFP